MSKLGKQDHRLIGDKEVRLLAERVELALGDRLSRLLRCYGVSAEDHFRFRPLAARFEGARERHGLSLKTAALALRVPQYRLAAIEGSRIQDIDPTLVARYVEHLGLRSWFGRWMRANPELAQRLRLTKPVDAAERPVLLRARAARASGAVTVKRESSGRDSAGSAPPRL